MADLDLNLLVALHALLETNSVTRAAERLNTSPPAMSRTLARLRRVYGDPLLVRAGRELVPTPRALELRFEVSALVEQGRALLAKPDTVDPTALVRGFALHVDDAVLPELAGQLLTEVRAHAPGVTLRFVPADAAGAASALRDGRIDVEVGVVDRADPQTRVERIRGDRLIGVAAPGHPLVADRVTVAAYAAAAHISISPRGIARGVVDDRLALHGRTRRVVATVPDLTTALLAVRSGAVVCPAPAVVANTTLPALGLYAFEIPLPLPEMTISLAWHPRNTPDPAHAWLRTLIRTVLRSGDPVTGTARADEVRRIPLG
ncbi:LysR family transcriptional regulator [Nocardia flavorosea]|uniref:LysR family transcriptional regulator n=1 Tax=Nocardia flavorosea TaxID=53429 RepID=A0A846YPZ1_9NOCA|nr:LysR family transcriptional regulator [Nocardia flavorosea]NKY59781.1 LysR family transcriptional regulator [Nocardia flavorosea]